MAAPSFWEWPLQRELVLENELSASRDLCTAERTYLATLKLSLTLAVSSCTFTKHSESLTDWLITVSLAGTALFTLFIGLYSYTRAVDNLIEDKFFHTPHSLIFVLLFLALLILGITLHEWYDSRVFGEVLHAALHSPPP